MIHNTEFDEAFARIAFKQLGHAQVSTVTRLKLGDEDINNELFSPLPKD